MEVQDHASLEEHDLDRFVKGEVTEPEDEVARAKAKRELGKSKGDDEACVGSLRSPADTPWSKELSGMFQFWKGTPFACVFSEI